MKYSLYNDYELLEYINENNEEAVALLYKKYEPIIKNIASKMYPYCKNNGIDMNDLIQEGMVGLTRAISNFKDNKNASFYTFSIRCIERSMTDLFISSKRLKHKILNESLPLELETKDGQEINLENFVSSENDNPEYMLLNKEEESNIIKEIKSNLTDFELQVFELKYSGFDYKEIGIMLDKDKKSVDNALQRIKSKLNRIINNEKK